jgi:hypothetical protein
VSRVVEVAPERWDGWLERFEDNNREGPQRIVGVERFDHDPFAVVLVRRGGYAVAVVEAGSIVTHKVGRRHVQSRTAAGGWSQQRFARRRGNQADELVRAVRDHACRLLVRPPVGESGLTAFGLVVGGDRALVTDVLDDPRLAALAALPRRELYDLPDPTRTLLDTAVARGRAVRVAVED